MRLCDILSVDRILVDADGASVRNKPEALRVLAELLSPALGIDKAHVEALLLERERLLFLGLVLAGDRLGRGCSLVHRPILG